MPIVARVRALNRWRDGFNPLRNLTLARAVALLEAAQRGELTDLQWTYQHIEATDADLGALIERRTSVLLEMDWDIRVADDAPAGKKAIADKQAAALRAAYERIENLYEAIEHLAMASFRGYAHVEITPAELLLVDQWHVVRDGSRGAWKYNPEAASTSFSALGGDPLPPERFLLREVARPINRLALVKFVRQNLSQKDWDAFIEIYGIPGAVVIGPPNVPPGKEDEYQTAAGEIGTGGSGSLPHGSDVRFSDGPRGVNPFRAHLDYLSEKLILAGTGGMLTMLAQSGSGTLAGGAHKETFEMIGRAEARRISEIFQKQLDLQVLRAAGLLAEGERPLAYFQLAANEETDPAKLADLALKLSQAGYAMDPAELSEKLGYQVAAKPPAPAVAWGAAGAEAGQLTNRARPGMAAAPRSDSGLLGVPAGWLQPVGDLFAELEKRASAGSLAPADLAIFLEEAARRLPELFGEMDVAALADELEAALGAAALQGVRAAMKRPLSAPPVGGAARADPQP